MTKIYRRRHNHSYSQIIRTIAIRSNCLIRSKTGPITCRPERSPLTLGLRSVPRLIVAPPDARTPAGTPPRLPGSRFTTSPDNLFLMTQRCRSQKPRDVIAGLCQRDLKLRHWFMIDPTAANSGITI
ncbi:unnamed protein product [Danaus chrysippus]|uniref:(African queen) hypothetical protein n=1 Tax=Danaus chrysippus TaxID=151541 RepID=A0A8J2VSB1_9NEOP|nr:unnamed protein product [Danaus chrysippus]